MKQLMTMTDGLDGEASTTHGFNLLAVQNAHPSEFRQSLLQVDSGLRGRVERRLEGARATRALLLAAKAANARERP